MSYAILDIETTGGSPKKERITEIAVYIHNGKEIVDEFTSLINPEKSIPAFISGLTGISNEMVADAPRFYEVARKIVEMTKDKTLVGHNVNFDYRFIQQEFANLGYEFRRDSLCTVQLSRKLLPGFKSYSLGKLCNNLNIHIKDRHRASGDAYATVKLFELLMEKDRESKNGTIGIKTSRGRYKNLNGFLEPENIEKIPSSTGVYYLHDSQGNVIYIGKSKNIHTRILSHLGNKTSKRSIEMREKVAGISYELTGSELIALLMESAEIKKNKPRYNRAQRRTSDHWNLYSSYDQKGYINYSLKQTGQVNAIPVTSFNNKAEALKILNKLVEKFWLCQKLSGLYETEGACFHYDIRQCNGACIGKEPVKKYNERAKKLLNTFEMEADNMIIIDTGRNLREKSVVLIEKGVYKGYGYLNVEDTYVTTEDFRNCINPAGDNREIRYIIRSWLRKNRPEKLIYL